MSSKGQEFEGRRRLLSPLFVVDDKIMVGCNDLSRKLSDKDVWTPESLVMYFAGAFTVEGFVGVLTGDGIAGSELSLASPNPSGICHSKASEDMLPPDSGGEAPSSRPLFCPSSGCSRSINRLSISFRTMLFFHEETSVSEPSDSLPIEAK